MRLADGDERYAADAELVVRLRAGDEAAFLDLVDRLTPVMRKIARAYVRDDAAADDVVQDAWLGVLRGLEGFGGRSSLRGWVCAIVVNRAKTRGVRDARAVPFSALASAELDAAEPSVPPERFAGPGEPWPGHWRDDPAPWSDQPERRLLDAELRRELDAAVEALPPVQRTVVLLRDYAEKSSAEVGNDLGLSETNVRVLLHRGRAKLRHALDPYMRRDSY